MKVLFLDIDGVLNNNHTLERFEGALGIDPAMVKSLKFILYQTKAKVVLSSTWRLYPSAKAEVERVLAPYEVIDVTPDNNGLTSRGTEIQQWLDAHPEVERYAILDDNEDFLEHQKPNFFQTFRVENGELFLGLTSGNAAGVIGHFNLYDGYKV